MNINHQDARPVAIWIVIATIAVHFIEEYAMNFPGWANRFFSMPITFEDFHLVNAAVALYAIACGVVGWRLPAFSLTIAGLIGLNGVFHAGAGLIERDISFNEAAVLAKEAEESLLYRDMEADLVQQLMRRLAALRLV